MIYATSVDISEDILKLASVKVDELTFNRINKIGFDNLTDFQKNSVELATLYQAEYFKTYGTEMGLLTGFSVSGMSMSFGNGVVPGVSTTTLSLLKQTGLMSRVVG
jgi:hypothetical protein